MALHAVRPGELRERAEQRYKDGIYVGSLIAGAVMSAEAQLPIDFEGAKRRAVQLTAHLKGNRSHASLDKTVLPRFRPIGHLWASYVWGISQGADRAAFPCRLDGVTEFLTVGEFFRERAIGIRFPRRGGRPGNTLLDARQAYRLPPGLPITRLEVLFGKI